MQQRCNALLTALRKEAYGETSDENKRKRSVLAPSPPQMVILRVCMVLLALLLAAITLLNRGSDTVMNTAYPPQI